MLVAISGVDGSGKSTQIDLLVEALQRAGQEPVVLWFRPGYSQLLDGLKQAVRRRRPSLVPSTAQPEARQAAFRRPWVRAAWIGMAVTDVFLNLGMWVRWQSARGRVVLCDRYLFDAMLDLELRFAEFVPIRSAVEAVLRRLLPKPDLSLLLMVPREVMHDRLAKKEEPFPDPEELRDQRYDRYQAWAESGRHVVVIDGARSIDEVHAEIVALVSRALGRTIGPVLKSG